MRPCGKDLAPQGRAKTFLAHDGKSTRMAHYRISLETALQQQFASAQKLD